ncbi:4-amino-4-deoxychorismate synthase [Sporobolomyces koalae]|uniref:4-amino-4-deoxychorismate synthase n=1 Tax=Sporobolomyces koalae TaxID=500713 RepID=UPI003170E6BA
MPHARAIPTTLVIDFHDSYTRNLLQLVAQLDRTRWNPAEVHGRIVVVNIDTLRWDDFVANVLPRFDCIVLGPGPGTPHKDEDFCWATRLIREYGHRLPILGVCLGCQGLATTFGAKVGTAAAPVHGQVSHISHSNNPLFDEIPQTFDAVQYNSLVIDPDSVPSAELEVIATNEAREIMALAVKGKPMWGVQFHPESICSTFGAKILDNFFTATLEHLARAASPNLPTSILALSTTARRRRPAPQSQEEQVSRWERHTVALAASKSLAPQQVFEQLVKGHSGLGEVWLDSARPTGVPQFSHVFNPESTLSYTMSSHSLIRRNSNDLQDRTEQLDDSTTVFDYLASEQSLLQARTQIQSSALASIPTGFVGYISYEAKAITMPPSRPTTQRHPDESQEHPVTEFAFASRILSYAHDTGEWYASALVRTVGSSSYGIDENEWNVWIQNVKDYFNHHEPRPFEPIEPVPLDRATYVPDRSREQYMASIESARASIVLGNAYELCLTTQFRSTLSLYDPLVQDPYPLYLSLRKTNPAPYSAYLNLPRSDLTILSSSPERFLQSTSTGHVSMKPIKGTVKRCRDDPIEDIKRRESLRADEKERAENLMIVDLIRNDLLAFCQVESVTVPALMQIETYETVHQMVTTVVGQMKEGVNPFDAVSQAFPPGSMTGAPKLRSLQLLDELEQRRSRGIYSGVFGYVSIDGASDWSVVIRTLIKRGQELSLGAGGAITHLSDPAKEWEEVLTKIQAVLGRGNLSK